MKKILLAILLLGIPACSAGPQLPTTVTNISCTWSGSGDQHDSDCMIDRTSETPTTTGNDNRGLHVDPNVPVSVTTH